MRIAMILMILLSGVLTFAQEDAEIDNAVKKVQSEMTDPVARKKLLNTQKAKNADANVQALAQDPQTADEIYALAADILPSLAQQANGDTNKMMQLLMEAQKNPAAFGKTFTPEQRARLKEISGKIESRKGIKKNIP